MKKIFLVSIILFVLVLTACMTTGESTTKSLSALGFDTPLPDFGTDFKLEKFSTVSEKDLKKDMVISGKGAPEIYALEMNGVRTMVSTFSPGGEYILSALEDPSLFTVSPFECVRVYRGSSGIKNAVCFSADCEYLFAISDTYLFKWDTVTGKLINSSKLPQKTPPVTFSASLTLLDEGKKLLIYSGNGLYVYDIASEKYITISAPLRITSALAIPETTKYIIFERNSSSEATYSLITCRDLDNDSIIWSYKIKKFNAIDGFISADSSTIAVHSMRLQEGTADKEADRIDFINCATGNGQKVLETSEDISSIYPLFSQGMLVLADNKMKNFYFYDITEKKLVAKLDISTKLESFGNKSALYRAMLISPLIASNNEQFMPISLNYAGIIDLSTGDAISLNIKDTIIPFTSFGIGKDNQLAVSNEFETGSSAVYNQLKDLFGLAERVWDITTGDILHHEPNQNELKIAKTVWELEHEKAFTTHKDLGFYSDSSFIKPPEIRSESTGRVIHGLNSAGAGRVLSFFIGDFSPDGTLLATSPTMQALVEIWNVNTGRRIRTITPTTGVLSSLQFSMDGKYIYGANSQGIQKWRVEDGKFIGSFFATAEGGWVTTSSDGYFNANRAGAEKLRVRMGNRLYPLDSFYDQFYNPLEVAAAFSIGMPQEQAIKVSQPAKSIQDITILPPNVGLYVKQTDGSFAKALAALQNTDQSEIAIRVEAVSSNGKIGEIKVRNNGKIIDTEVRGLVRKEETDRVVQDFLIPLVEGSNRITAVALSEQLIESAPASVSVNYTSPVAVAPDMYVLAVGIDEYKNERYSLDYAVGDVEGFIGSLAPIADSLYDEMFITTLKNDQAVRTTLISELESIAAKANPEDVFVFYYAGHGIALTDIGDNINSEFYYVLHDVTQMTSPDKIREAGISGEEIRGFFQKVSAMKQLALIDACNSGAFAESFAYRGAAEEQALAKLSRATGSAIIAATRDDQFASELKALGHGAFTMAVIEALNGRAASSKNLVTASSVRLYLDDRLPEITVEYSGSEQYPISFIFGQDFPIGIIP